ncbi:MAG: presqualene diphosphate synthase HpnD [Limisphaerales bacterium]
MSSQSRTITRKSASNLALAFILLPKAKREAMSALYAFCREVDDVADEETAPVEQRRARLAEWREDIQRAASGGAPVMAVNRELQPVIAQYRLSLAHFEELIRGVEMDLDIKRYQTYADLEQYCYRVASVVGLLSIEIFGYKNASCREYAVHLGKALQLTNILRDVRVDAERGRIYLPLSELERHQVTPEEILRLEYSERYARLAEDGAALAKKHFAQARQILAPEDRRAMIAAQLMGSVYWRLLRQLERQRFNVFGPERVRLSRGEKTLLILRGWLRFFTGAPADY